MSDDRCPQCGEPTEFDSYWGEQRDYCGRCEDILIERSNRMCEWEYYHPDTPRCPENEMPSLPKRGSA